ncbi:hypothetical protein [Kordiimonas lacus]|uniref:Replication region DNA-binding N-term n=1 Tax=Kordiimonas lacus TaxID=637679 RepID=A0A1G7E113_9PROT|nr:hypothetical protein [Kordiimonas lacus]SDE57331.1 hypothetical protein SAMN04488071_3234 [Kordiimonas lacus]
MMKSRDKNCVRQDFEDAIARILANKPRNPTLRTKAERGSLKMNISNVALEAGRSRTLVGKPDTEYADVRRKIIDLMEADIGASATERIIKELREQRDLCRVERDRAMSEAHKYLIELEKAQRRILQLKTMLERYQKAEGMKLSSVSNLADRPPTQNR